MSFNYDSMDVQPNYEVWGGVQIIKESSSLPHEQVLGQLHLLLIQYVNHQSLGRVFLSNTAVYAEEGTRDFVCPDLTYVSNEKKHQLRRNGIFGAPDLIVEIISPGLRNTTRDAVDKFKLYEKNGVQEYWMVDFVEREVHMYGLKDGIYDRIGQSSVLPGIELPLDVIFQDVDDY